MSEIKNKKLYIIFAILSIVIVLWVRVSAGTGLFVKEIVIPIVLHNKTPIKVGIAFDTIAWMFFFTNIANIFFCIITFGRVFYRKKILSDYTQIIIGVYMILVGLIYWTLIGPFEIAKRANDSFLGPDYFGEYIFNNVLIHGVTVVMAIILIFKGVDKTKIQYINLLKYGLIFPFVYYIGAWILYLITWKVSTNNNPVYIYGFLNFFQPFEVKNVSIVIVMNIIIFIGMFCILCGLFYLVIKIQPTNITKRKQIFKKNNK